MTRPRSSIDVALRAALAGLSACGGLVAGAPGGATDAGADAAKLPVPSSHRAVATPCPTTRDPSSRGYPDLGGACSRDSDCTAGRNGRCVELLPMPPTCSYDECFVDGDCAGGACACRIEAGANVCARGHCRLDADCGAGGYCSPSPTECYGIAGYYCRTPNDRCLNDVECASMNGGAVGTCAYDTTVGRWQCLARTCPL